MFSKPDPRITELEQRRVHYETRIAADIADSRCQLEARAAQAYWMSKIRMVAFELERMHEIVQCERFEDALRETA